MDEIIDQLRATADRSVVILHKDHISIFEDLKINKIRTIIIGVDAKDDNEAADMIEEGIDFVWLVNHDNITQYERKSFVSAA